MSINNDCTLSPDYITREPIDSMYYYAKNNIPDYVNISSYPNSLRYNPYTNSVTNFSHAFENCKKINDSYINIYSRFNWNSCTDISSCFNGMIKLHGNVNYVPEGNINMASAFRYTNVGPYVCIPLQASNLSNTYAYTYNAKYIILSSTGYYELPNDCDITSIFRFGSLEIDIGKCRFYNITNFAYAFQGTNIYGRTHGISTYATNMAGAFSNTNITSSDSLVPSMIVDFSSAYENCKKFTSMHTFENRNYLRQMYSSYRNCVNAKGTVPNIPVNVIDVSYCFENCKSLSSSNIYIYSNRITSVRNFTYGCTNVMNIYVHANTTTYNSFYEAMGGTYNADWGPAYLKTF